jgi:ribosomal protein S18 acetylase RimI-like enzyme
MPEAGQNGAVQTPDVTSPTPVDIRLVRPQDTELLDAVVELGDRFNKRLGFLPPAAYKQKAGQGTLLAATIGGRLAGYTLFGLPGQRVRLTHLCVDGEFQGRGIARLLVEEISARHVVELAMVNCLIGPKCASIGFAHEA